MTKLTNWPPPNQAVELECRQIVCSPAEWDVNVNRPDAAYVYKNSCIPSLTESTCKNIITQPEILLVHLPVTTDYDAGQVI